jgi:translocation and assembly module TamB
VIGRVTGPRDDPAVTVHAAGRRLAVAGVALGDPVADVSVAGLTAEPQGKVALTATPGGAGLRAQTGFRVGSAGGIRLDGLTVDGDGGTRLAGNLAFGGDGLMDGTLDGAVADLTVWQQLAGTKLAGAVELRLTAAPVGGEQKLVIAATGSDLSAADVATIATLDLDAEIRDALATPALDLQLAAEDVATSSLSFDTVRATAQGGLTDLGWTLAAAGDEAAIGTKGSPAAALDARGRLALGDDGGTLTVASLAASLASLEAALTQPAVVAWGDQGVRIDGVDATIGDGRLSASGRFAEGAMALDATLVDLPVKPFSELAGDVVLEGSLSGQAALSGDPAAPDGRATLTLSDLREAEIDPAEATALNGEATAVFGAGRVDATARLFGPADLALDAEVSVPLAGDGPLAGKATGSIDLALIPRIVDLRGDALSGRLDLDLALSGRRDRPQIGGRATIAGGAYESATQGTVLRDLAAEVVGDVNRVRLASLSANDGAGGRISGTGALTVDADAGFPLEAAITLDKFTALRRADATVQMSGALDIDRAGDGGRIAGRLRVDSAELRVPDRLSGEVVTLEVTEINLPPGRERIVPPPRTPAAPLDLDIDVEVPRRAFLRGRGLESEWQGRLKVGGTTATPDIVGSLSVVRGSLDLLGRVFRFDTGNVNFVGGDEIDPELDFVATSEAEALTVHAAVSGTASAPSFELSSEPLLPQDEVLARLLFGSSAGSLTPVQAVQLAQTAATLSGRGGSVSVLDELRQGFGLDMLGVESGETVSSSSLAVGKYLTDDVFVKMNQGLTPESRKVGVEVKVLPQVTVESDIGAESQGSVGVNWKLDY